MSGKGPSDSSCLCWPSGQNVVQVSQSNTTSNEFWHTKSPSPAAYFNKVAPLGLGSLSICTFGLFANLLCFSFGIFWLPLALWHWLGALPFRCRKLRLQFEPVGTEGAHGANALPGILNLCALCSSELCDLHWPWMAHLLWKHLQMIGPCVIVNSKHT